jgi:acetolactate synthase I/III small subunit
MYQLSVLAENKPGVLMRVAGVVTARGLNIDRVSVEPEGSYSAIHLSFQTDEVHQDQIRRKVLRLVEVIDVRD